jgi:hypothetical protein
MLQQEKGEAQCVKRNEDVVKNSQEPVAHKFRKMLLPLPMSQSVWFGLSLEFGGNQTRKALFGPMATKGFRRVPNKAKNRT